MKLIDVSSPKYPNTFVQVDDADFEHLNQWKWYVSAEKHTAYARRQKRANGLRKDVSMHREILLPPKNITVDHIDGNGLNNQRSNLRLATNSENQRNRAIQSNNTSGYIGVFWRKRESMWIAVIESCGKKHHIILSHDPIIAAKARDAAAIKYHGEFARLNFPTSNQKAIP